MSAEEIEAASKKANEEEEANTSKSPNKETSPSTGVNTLPTRIIEERDDRNITSQKKKDDPLENEWLPDSITGPKKRGKGKKRWWSGLASHTWSRKVGFIEPTQILLFILISYSLSFDR